MTFDDSQTKFFLNNDDANQVYRICTMHGVDSNTANKIAIDVGRVEARSKKGELKAIAWDKFKNWWGTAVVAGLGGIGTFFLWFFDIIKFGGGS